jgi:cytochrome c biogenesis protein CcmG/thiol:disulfide interchange protein DsbE
VRAFALLAVFAALGAAPTSANAPIGSAAPPLHATTLAGTPLNASSTAGKVTVLNFWATWCPPCRAETPDMNAAYRKLHAPDVAFLGIDTTETAPIIKTFLSAKGVPYPSALAGPDLYNGFGIAYIPTTIVLDAHGIVRARWVGGIEPAQLASYIAAARAGRNAVFSSPQQTAIDAALNPARYNFSGTHAHRNAVLAAAQNAIARADATEDKNQAVVDDEKTQREEGLLRIAAGTALRDAATTPAQKAAALALLAHGQGDLNLWADAAQTDHAALALLPGNPSLTAMLSHAYYRLHDYPAMIEQAKRYVTLRPADGDGWSDLGLAYQRTHQFASAVPAYVRSLALLRAATAKAPTQDNIADVADTSLDLANVYVSLGDVKSTRATFAQANTYGDRLDPKGRYIELKRNVKERTQEGLIAVALAGGSGKPVLSVAPWTGPDLPGSVASTLKYRLIVAAGGDSAVTLHANGLTRDWVGSFCADGLCSPQQVSFRTPATGVKTYEFQLVPPAPGARPGTVTISAAGGNTVTVPASH